MTKWKTVCPRCKREGEVVADATPTVSCGDCLFEDVEIVALTVTRLYRFKVCIQRYVEETAAVWIDAETPEKAAEVADLRDDGELGDWQAGDDIVDREVYAVLDNRGDIVWER